MKASHILTPARTQPLLQWPGGKSRLLKHILPLPPHICYVEPFAGGLAVLLAKPRSRTEVVNDINGDIVNLYRTAKFHPDALIAEFNLMPASRETLRDFLSQPGITEIQRAARFLWRNKFSFGGGGTSYGVSKSGGGGAAKSRQTIMDKIHARNTRMDSVSLENLPYERILKNYDAPDSFFFLDPPYVNADPGSAYRGWTPDEMREFASRALALKGAATITVDDSPLNRQLFDGLEFTAVQTRNGSCNKRLRPTDKFGELIIQKPAKKAACMVSAGGLQADKMAA